MTSWMNILQNKPKEQKVQFNIWRQEPRCDQWPREVKLDNMIKNNVIPTKLYLE